jgi:hypothetical protein
MKKILIPHLLLFCIYILGWSGCYNEEHHFEAGRQCLTPVILAPQEADIMGDCSKPAWAISLRDPISKKPITKKGWWSDSSGRAPA